MTIQNARNIRRSKPRIVISDVDQGKLNGLANAVADRLPELADELFAELERAKIVKANAVPANVVRMGSTLEYSADDGQRRTVTLVYPGDADIASGKISILTPIGTALLGLAEGQSIEWTARDDRRHRLTVLSVAAAGASAA